jgi:two-component system KDP operon response regulator KdpE
MWMPSGFASRMTAQRSSDGQTLPPLEDNPARPRHLLTEPGMGYRYQP